MEASDVAALCSEADVSLEALSTRLKTLEAQQTALLASIFITSDSLETLPSLATITPTMSLIPTYTNKVSRLKKTMASQTAVLSQLQRRANDVKLAREKNKKRMAELVEREGERDRTVLQAKYHGDTEVVGKEGNLQQQVEGEEPSQSAPQPSAGPSAPPGPSQPKLVIKRKKKPRQVEMD